MNFGIDYLKKLAGISTPDLKDEIDYEKKIQTFYSYCQLRNAAKDLLDNPSDKEAEKELSGLIKKLEISIE